MNLSPRLSRVNSQEWDCWVIWWVSVELYKKLSTHFPECSTTQSQFWTILIHALPAPISRLSRPQSGFQYRAKLPFGGCNFHLRVTRGKGTKLQFGLASLTWSARVPWQVGEWERGSGWGNGVCGQVGTWRYNLDPKPGKSWWFGLSLKHPAKDEMQNAFPVKQKLLRGRGSMELFVLQHDPLPRPTAKGNKLLTVVSWTPGPSNQRTGSPGNTCKSLSKSRERCVKCVPSTAHSEASGSSRYTKSLHPTPLSLNFLKTHCQQFDRIESSVLKGLETSTHSSREVQWGILQSWSPFSYLEQEDS